jgi:8-oxo-dGTP diphosphatase
MLEVVAAIICRNGRILITRRVDNVDLPGLWEFPGGKVEPSEDLEAALGREILEELGIRISVEREFFRVEDIFADKAARLHFFNCIIVDGDPQPIQAADLRWVLPMELDQFQFPAADAKLIRKLRRL